MNKVNDNSIKIKVNGAEEIKVDRTKMAKVVAPAKEAMPEREAPKKPKKSVDGKKKVGIIVLAVGAVALVAGVVFLLINLLKAPLVRDADYLVQIGTWQIQGQPSVEWKFTEIGKGTLTTNSHINDYDFSWAMEGTTLKIETSWLYTLDDEYTYKLDQDNQVLILTDESGDVYFVPASHIDSEVTENN